jgi:hypothetical protein
VPLVLGEAYVVVNFVTKAFFFDRIGTDLFDAVSWQGTDDVRYRSS